MRQERIVRSVNPYVVWMTNFGVRQYLRKGCVMLQKSLAAGCAASIVRQVFGMILFTGWLAAQTPADLILHNGKIVTVDNKFSIVPAIAVTGQRITAVGSNADMLKLSGPNTRVIDLKGKTVVPGLIDTHLHTHDIIEGAYRSTVSPDKLNRLPIDWRGVRNKSDVLTQIKNTMDKYQFEPGRWLYFIHIGLNSGSRDDASRKRKMLYDELTRWDLDTVTPNNPVILDMGTPDTSAFFVNSKAMAYLDQKYGDFIKKYGRLWVDSSGRPDGHLEPPANRLLFPQKNNRDPQVLAPLYKYGLEEIAAMGMTAFSSRFPEDTVGAYRLLESKGELTARIAYGLENFAQITDVNTEMKAWADKIGTGSDKVWINSLGAMAIDGAGARDCASVPRLAPVDVVDSYWPRGACNVDVEYQGAAGKAMRTPGNYFRDWMVASGVHGARFANTHVSGDRSIKLLLNLAEQAVETAGPNAVKGWAFDHCTIVDPGDLPRVAKLGMMFSCGPLFITNESRANAYGEKIANTWFVPVKSILNHGIKVAYEGDRDSYVWSEIELLITRKDDKGKIWAPQERVDRREALIMITRVAAEYILKGDQLGTLEPGKLADLVVLDRDYMTIPEEQISEIQPQVTVFDGKIVFVHPQSAQEYNLRPAGAVIATYQELLARRPSENQQP